MFACNIFGLARSFIFTQEREIKDLSGGELQRFSIAGGYCSWKHTSATKEKSDILEVQLMFVLDSKESSPKPFNDFGGFFFLDRLSYISVILGVSIHFKLTEVSKNKYARIS